VIYVKFIFIFKHKHSASLTHMKKAVLILIISVLMVNLTYGQTDWITYKIDNKLSIKLPAQPNAIDERTNKVMDKDNNVYLVAVIDLTEAAGIDSAQLAAYAPKPEFANGIKNGMLKKVPGLSLGDVKVDKWNGYYCYHIEGGNVEKKLKLFTYEIIIGSKMYGFTAMIHEDKNISSKDDFFNSLVLN